MSSTFWNNILADENDTNKENDFFSKSFNDSSGTQQQTVSQQHAKTIPIKHEPPSNSESIHELAIDIYQTEDRIYIVIPLAGVRSSDIEISVNEQTINIKGKRKNPFEDHLETLYSSECFWGNFERTFTLPSSTDTRAMSSTFRSGILLIEAPRVAPSGVRLIKIN